MRLLDEKTGRWIKADSDISNVYEPKIISIRDLKPELFSKDRQIIIVKETIIPELKISMWDTQPKTELSSDVLIIDNYYPQYNYEFVRHITLNNLIVEYTYFPKDFKIEIVDEAHPRYSEIISQVKKYEITNLQKNLHHDWDISSGAELFAEDEDGNCIPAFTFLPDKKNPAISPGRSYQASDNPFGGNGGKVMYHRQFAAKFNTKVVKCLGYHMDSVAAGVKGVFSNLKDKYPKGKLSLKSLFDFSKEYLSGFDSNLTNLVTEKVSNAYGLVAITQSENNRIVNGSINFHIKNLSVNKAKKIVKTLDAILGTACVSLFSGIDSPDRRKYAGLPGEYKLTKGSLQYRGISNAWLSHPIVANLVIDLARKVVVFADKEYEDCWNASEKEVLDCMFNCDVSLAQSIIHRNEKIFGKLLSAAYIDWIAHSRNYNDSSDKTSEHLPIIKDCFFKGIKSFIKDPYDLETNWKLNGEWAPHTSGSEEPNVQSYVENYVKSRKTDW